MSAGGPAPQSSRAALFAAMEAQQRGDFQAAIASYERILEHEPRNADAWLHLGIAMHRTNRKDLAENAFLRSLALNESSHAAHVNLGTLYFREKKFAEARPYLEAAYRLNDADVRAPTLLGRIADEEGLHREAVEHFQHAVALKPDDLKLLRSLVRSLTLAGSHDEALDWILLAVDRNPAQMELRIELALILRALGRHGEALETLRTAVAEKPDDADLQHNLGALLEEKGDFREGSAAYREALRLNPEHTLALASALRSRIFQPDHAMLCARAEAALAAPRPLDLAAEIFLRYSLGKHLDATAEHDRAIEHFHRANALQRQQGEYVPAAFSAFVDEMIETFTPALMTRLSAEAPAERPIFIVGLPRSGTTLVEQILSGHPRVAAGGEISFFLERTASMFVHGHAGVRYPKAAQWLSGDSASKLREEYSARSEQAAPGAQATSRRVTDKMPLNFQHLGLIKGLFPRATIVYCRRDPLDNGLSCYFENLTDRFRFATSLAGLGHYYREHSRLMAHWARVLEPGSIFEVGYESLIRDFEPQVRELLAHCGLPWDERCLRFFEAQRVIATPSNWQVRQPIYSTSVSRWRAYDSHLEELRAALGAQGGVVATQARGVSE